MLPFVVGQAERHRWGIRSILAQSLVNGVCSPPATFAPILSPLDPSKRPECLQEAFPNAAGRWRQVLHPVVLLRFSSVEEFDGILSAWHRQNITVGEKVQEASWIQCGRHDDQLELWTHPLYLLQHPK